jgi:hypothetical protein
MKVAFSRGDSTVARFGRGIAFWLICLVASVAGMVTAAFVITGKLPTAGEILLFDIVLVPGITVVTITARFVRRR